VALGVLGCFPVAAQQDCLPDPQLTEAAAELLLAHDERPAAQTLSSAVRAAGSDAVGVHALFVPAGVSKDSEVQWLAGLRTRVDGELQCGRADNGAGRLLIALGRAAALEPIDANARIVRGRLNAGFRDAELVIETADAQLIRVGVSPDSLSQGVELAAELIAPLKVQLVARGPAGPRPVAEREVRAPQSGAPALAEQDVTDRSARTPLLSAVRAEDGKRAGKAVHSSMRPATNGKRAGEAAHPGAWRATDATSGERAGDLTQPGASRAGEGVSAGTAADAVSGERASKAARPVAGPAADADSGRRISEAIHPVAGPATDAASGGELSRRLLALRAERGRGRLRENRLLREAANLHATEVCAKGRVAHEVEPGVGPDERLARAGLDARVLGEAIARAEGTQSALDALKNSPSHLFTLLDPRFTDFGIGVARDSAQKYCFVVLLCAWPRYVGKRR
jgi:uncharacterized protein YkwD